MSNMTPAGTPASTPAEAPTPTTVSDEILELADAIILLRVRCQVIRSREHLWRAATELHAAAKREARAEKGATK